MSECEEIEFLYKKLEKSEMFAFPETGKVQVSKKQGVYIVYHSDESVLHVGRTPRGKNGLNQRLYNHITGSSSFSRKYLKPHKISLRKKCTFRFIEVEDVRKRAFLESLTVGRLCPAHIGTSEKNKNIDGD